MTALDTVLLVVAVVFLFVAAVEATRFPVRYRVTTWRRTREGRHLMRFTAALAVALWGTLLQAVLPLPLWVSLLVQAAVFAWLAFELHYRNRLFTWNQRGE